LFCGGIAPYFHAIATAIGILTKGKITPKLMKRLLELSGEFRDPRVSVEATIRLRKISYEGE
jgi:hypothetical protein